MTMFRALIRFFRLQAEVVAPEPDSKMTELAEKLATKRGSNLHINGGNGRDTTLADSERLANDARMAANSRYMTRHL